MTLDNIEKYSDLNSMKREIQVLHDYIDSMIQRMDDRPNESGAIAEGVLRDIVSMGMTKELLKFADGYQKHVDKIWEDIGYIRDEDGMLVPSTENNWEMT
tara:strand:+ start:880 stop:1179 length:300 start_codon:yes stop_codon:yes gene_type:complete